MRIQFLGTGGFHPSERRETACLMIPEIGLVFDAGTGAYRIGSYIQTKSLDLFLTHAHLDHICGLTYLITLTLSNQLDEIRLWGRAEVLNAVREHLFAQPVFPVAPPFQFFEIEENGRHTLSSGNVVEWQKLESHPGGSTAYKLYDGDLRIAYVTDTEIDGSYSDFIHGADLLIHECYFPDEKAEWARKTGHTYANAVANLAKQTEVQRVVTVHPDPQADSDDPIGISQMQAIFPNIELAEDGLCLDITS